ncbi:5-oxoprolinase [Sulfolobus sp. A20]|uniref:hydantoinase/oxoprolinase family protein n=1 Tax=Sulfolobaceae TaxID=118883 RepID=UPI0008461F12|nr:MULTISPECIES: hydantoinase/oxoprolinase family protein [unclassified Sulfolobus]TRM76752.1 hydantoinase/oxoprolinase family protein [Sulfolobus sp. E5]TRM82416.1 hydantoinase/oxoprolinase family protein [Sulfolobus sp. D5]TRM88790.1 hydantoinase/oxoprolinase family protein [Sulfolobus sp. C3]TRM99446.1 hydantoinase/oxoprolinase family protein [Sulfolobus sp. F1]AOL17455.1 5-oxoprolinase [Sulfolobus sp. A20]
MIRIGIDIGGAFTDLVYYDQSKDEFEWIKVETTTQDPSIGVIRAVEESKVDLKNAMEIIHGQTLAINTIIERKGAKVGLITTKGFRDILEIQRANRRDMYNFKYRKPEPFVPRYLRREVSERITSSGEIITPLNIEELKIVADYLIKKGVESIAISFINSYVNPTHELKAKEVLKEIIGDNAFITLSHEITREWGEYERTNTAVLNAYIKPKMSNYLKKLKTEIDKRGFKGKYYSMLSNGGMATFDFAMDFPITTLESGPVAGIIGAIAIGELAHERNIIGLDGGSTTTKASLVENLMPNIITDYYIERNAYSPGYPVKVPTIDIVEVGNGGTSIAWIDEIDNLKVGPKAAGSYPGPAAYGRGGTEPTVTDAYIVTGLLNPSELLGGKLKVMKELAEKVISKIADHYKISVDEAAEGILKLANNNAVNVIRLVSVQRGYDPRDFALIAYGGSGPMFAPFIAEELDIKKVIVPFVPPGVFSAWGMLVADIRHDLVKTELVRIDKEDAIDKINSIFDELEKKILQVFASEGFNINDVVMFREAEMRYYGQSHTVKVNVMNGELGDKEIKEIVNKFHLQHEATYSFKSDSPIEIVNFRVYGIIKARKVPLLKRKLNGNSVKETTRNVFINGRYEEFKVYDKSTLPTRYKVPGPAVLEDPTSTIIILKGQRGEIDEYGNVIITR